MNSLVLFLFFLYNVKVLKRGKSMEFINIIKEKAKGCLKTIVLPEANDVRVLKATEIICKEKIANMAGK